MLNSQTQVLSPNDSMSRWLTPVMAVLTVLFGLWFLSTGVSQLVVAILLMFIGGLLILLRPNVAIISTLVYLAFMGDIRRYVSAEAGVTTHDPLLLVAPAIAAMFFAKLLFERRIQPNTIVAKLVVALMIYMAIEIVNPLQGGITVGVAGAIFFLVPLLWFWIGHSIPSEGLTRQMLWTVIPSVAGAAAILGLFQTFEGWLWFERHWIQQQAVAGGFVALIVEGGVVRPFSFFTSPAEYAFYLSVGVACCAAPLIAGRRRLTAILLPLLGIALFLAAVRTAIALSLIAVMVMWSLLGRDTERMIGRAFLAFIVCGGALVFGLSHVAKNDTSRAGTLLARDANGLESVNGSRTDGHGDIALAGIIAGLKNPIGNGLGSTTMAAGKFGKGGGGYELDIANAFAGLGALGGILYVAIIVCVFRGLFGLWERRRSLVALAVLGILVAHLGSWLDGGQYSLAALTWFLIGSLDRASVPVIDQPSAGPRTFGNARNVVRSV